MKWFRIALLAGFPLLAAASPSGPPAVDVNTTCHARGVEKSAVQNCIREEQSAGEELKKMWAQVPGTTRQNCAAEIKIGGSPSYVDLLTCVQMDQWSRERPPGDTGPAGATPGAASGPRVRRP
jgi:hypothetical protein